MRTPPPPVPAGVACCFFLEPVRASLCQLLAPHQFHCKSFLCVFLGPICFSLDMMLPPQIVHLDQFRIGRILHQARLDLGMSLRDAARLSGLSHTHVMRIENGELEVSMRNFIRLSVALGFPAGLLIEAATLVGRGVFHPLNDERVKRMAQEAGRDASSLRGQIADFAAGSALVVAYLVTASNPVFMVERFSYPVAGQKDAFRKLAQKIETTFSPVDRLDVLAMLAGDTVNELSVLQLFTRDFASAYVALCGQKNPPLPLPWIPVPAPPFVDIFQKPTDNPYEVEARLLQIQEREHDSKRGPRKQAPINRQVGLDNVIALPDSAAVKQKIRSLPDLIRELRSLTKARGRKVLLAEAMKVSRQAVDQWLSCEAIPSTETTFKLIRWIERGGK